MVTHYVHDQLLKENLARTGLYQWINIFDGEIKRFGDLEEDELEKYDVIHINLSAQDYHLPNLIRDKLGKGSSTKIVCNGDYTTELWQGSFDFPQTFKHLVKSADMVFGTEEYMVGAMEEVYGRKVHMFPHPCHVKRLKILRPDNKEDFISTIWHRYDNMTLLPYLATRNHGLKTQLIGYNGAQDKKSYATTTMYNRILGGTNFQEFCNQMMRSELLYEPFTLHSHGRATIDTAALGLPVVGSNRLQSMNKCYPYTAIDPYDITKSRELIQKIIKDDDFKQKVIDTARENVDYYNYKNSKERFVKALEESE